MPAIINKGNKSMGYQKPDPNTAAKPKPKPKPRTPPGGNMGARGPDVRSKPPAGQPPVGYRGGPWTPPSATTGAGMAGSASAPGIADLPDAGKPWSGVGPTGSFGGGLTANKPIMPNGNGGPAPIGPAIFHSTRPDLYNFGGQPPPLDWASLFSGMGGKGGR